MNTMTLKGRIFMCLTFLFIGVAIGLVGGYKFAKANMNTGNQVTNNYDIKAKRGSVVNTEMTTEQVQVEEEEEEDKWWWPF